MMKRIFLSRMIILALTVIAFGFVGTAKAQYNDDPDPREIVEGIIGGILSGVEKDDEDEYQSRCERLERRCDDGADWACDRYEERCE